MRTGMEPIFDEWYRQLVRPNPYRWIGSDDDLGGEVILGDPPEDEEGGPDVDTDDVEAS